MPTSKRKYEEEESEVFHVEVITKARVALPFSDEEDEDGQGQVRRKKGKSKRAKKAKWVWFIVCSNAANSNDLQEYFVKWANYDSDANSWEPEENVAGCQRLLASFWDHVGTDNGDYDVGYEVAAQEKWIKKEKRYFSQEYEEAQENLRKKREKDGRNGRKKTSLAADLNDNSTDKKPLLPAKRKFNSETSEDDIPLSKLPPRKTTKTNTATAVVIDSEPSNEPTGSLFSSPEPEPAPTVPAPPRPPPRPLPGVKQTPIPPKPIYPDNAVEPSPENTASGKGLSTKQRLSQRALDALPLKANRLPATKHKQLPLPRNPSSSMFPLGFKKKTMSTPVPIGGSLDKTTPPIPSYEQPNVAFSHQNQIERLQQPILPPSNDAHMEAADAFLRNIMPPDLAGPLEPAVEHPFEREPPKALPKQLSAPK
ncbi:hypothetical protein DXG01_000055 [Tephrocybe rancida]|nr:hypothetical protein DXG01_000055 [Tephrocybe rancida]